MYKHSLQYVYGSACYLEGFTIRFRGTLVSLLGALYMLILVILAFSFEVEKIVSTEAGPSSQKFEVTIYR